MPTPRGYDADPRPLYRGGPDPYPGADEPDFVMHEQIRGRDPVTPRGYSVMRGQMRRPSSAAGRLPLWWGSLTGRAGVCIVAGGAAAGAVLTVLAGTGPGALLGVFLVAGTLVAALAIQPRVVYRIIPVPVLAYAVTAPIAGVIGDRAASVSHTALAISAAQWIASGFLPMAAATLLAIVVTAIRWLTGRPAAGATRRGPRTSRRPARPPARTGPSPPGTRPRPGVRPRPGARRRRIRSAGARRRGAAPPGGSARAYPVRGPAASGCPQGCAARTARWRSTSTSSRSRRPRILPWRTSARTSSAVAPASA